MKKEIGGYLELEEPAGQEYYPDLCGVNLGRTALLWLNLPAIFSLRFRNRCL